MNLEWIMRHPWGALAPRAVFLVRPRALVKISNANPSRLTDFGDGNVSQADTAQVWKQILAQGMNDPMMVNIGYRPDPRSATIRLESGNHRVLAAMESHIQWLPTVGFIQANPIFASQNGFHTFPIDPLQVERYYQSLGRRPALFDPYPHPADLSWFFPAEDVRPAFPDA